MVAMSRGMYAVLMRFRHVLHALFGYLCLAARLRQYCGRLHVYVRLYS